MQKVTVGGFVPVAAATILMLLAESTQAQTTQAQAAVADQPKSQPVAFRDHAIFRRILGPFADSAFGLQQKHFRLSLASVPSRLAENGLTHLQKFHQRGT